MEQMTITEALQEIKTIKARIEKKRQNVHTYFAREAMARDPLENEGGSQKFVKEQRQGAKDLADRLVRIRCAIQKVNLNTTLVLGGETHSLAYWLNWRREISAGEKNFLQVMSSNIARLRQATLERGGQKVTVGQLTDKDPGAVQGVIVVSVSETELAKEVEDMEQLLGDLDGKLSLLNATVTVEF